MSSTLARYQGDITQTPLKTGGRADWYVESKPTTSGVPAPFVDTDIVAQLRRFFDALDAEATQLQDDPIAMVNALARLEALQADLRMVTQTVRRYAAEALHDQKVRQLTIENLVTVEGATESSRNEWQDHKLLTTMIKRCFADHIVLGDSGEVIMADVVAATILTWFRVQWRLTPIRAVGLDPDDYSTQPTDEDGKPIKTPTVRMVDNVLRKVG